MARETKTGSPDNKPMMFFGIISALLIVLSAFVGEILIPFSAAFFAALLVMEGKGRKFSVICVIISVVMTALFFGPASIWSTASVIVGFVIFICHKFGFTKCDTSVLITLILSLSFFASFVLIAFMVTGEQTFAGAIDFYEELFAQIKVIIISEAEAIYSAVPEFNENVSVLVEQLEYMLDSFVKTIPSLIMIISFVLSGIALKVYTRALRRYACDIEAVGEWKFSIPTVYAYFYILIYLGSIFITGAGVFSLVVINILGILSFMFAYMGFKFIYRKMCARGHRIMAVALPVLGILFAGAFAVDLLSVFGVVYTITESKHGGTSHNNNTSI